MLSTYTVSSAVTSVTATKSTPASHETCTPSAAALRSPTKLLMPTHTRASIRLQQALGFSLTNADRCMRPHRTKNKRRGSGWVPSCLIPARSFSIQSTLRVLQQQLEREAFVQSSIHTQRNKIFYQTCLQSEKKSEQNDALLGKREADCKTIC